VDVFVEPSDVIVTVIVCVIEDVNDSVIDPVRVLDTVDVRVLVGEEVILLEGDLLVERVRLTEAV
jgi:hypothetical protein